MKKAKLTPEVVGQQLNKYIAHSGLCSRRKAEVLIREGQVTVNGASITDPGYRVMPSDMVVVNNKHVMTATKQVYILLNKPKDYITTVSDPKGRKTVMSLIGHATGERLFPIGRLDRMTTGVLLLSNDGSFAYNLTHPKFEIAKKYIVELDMPLKSHHLGDLRAGVQLSDGITAVDEVRYLPQAKKQALTIVIHSGKNRIIRRLFEALGYKVKKLDRVDFAGISYEGLERGQWRYLTNHEIKKLKNYS